MFDFLKRPAAQPDTSASTRPTSAEPSLPAEVLSLLRRRDEINDDELNIHLLDEHQASARLHSKSVWGRLGLVTLDDAEDSDPYVLITRGVCAGMVAHYFHDREPQIEFATLQAFEAYHHDLQQRCVPLNGEDRTPTEHLDQAALAGALLELACADGDADAGWLICFYLGVLRRDDRSVLAVLAAHEDFFVREAAAEALGRIRTSTAAELLDTLALDAHPQVASAARRSVSVRDQQRAESGLALAASAQANARPDPRGR